ncbi:hypothetical protein EWI07_11080 [Sporolactobacillus sp. THM7-4]|nr:hypothetical protein EWI07_11080 [Sporolactobacillus sp. THM7-4]
MFAEQVIYQYFLLIIMVLALSLDSFSISMAIGMSKPTYKQIMKIGLVIGLFHTIMPLLGMIIGGFLSEHFRSIAALSGGVLLILMGLQMIIDFYKKRNERFITIKPTGAGLLFLAFSLSLDSFSVGLGLGVYKANIAATIAIFGVVNMILPWSGLLLGKRIHKFFGLYGELIGGLILLIIGLQMLLHLPV